MQNNIDMQNNTDISKKKQFIYNKVNDMTIDSNIFSNYINYNNLKYTKNKNGIFINLYSIEDEHIDNMYKIIVDKIQYTNLINNNDFDIKNQFITQNKITDNIINYKNINDENFDNYDIDLINFY